MADVREKVEQIRQAVYGKEVRESIASGIEAINTDIDALNDLVDALDSRVDTIITTPISGEAATQEIVDARVSAVKEKTFATLDARFEETEQDIATHKAEDVSQGDIPHVGLGGSISHAKDTGEVTTPHLRQVNASQDSTASGGRSQVNASLNSTASGGMSQVNASRNSTASGQNSFIISSVASEVTGNVSGIMCSGRLGGFTTGGCKVTANNALVLVGRGVLNDVYGSIAGGLPASSGATPSPPSTAERKYHLYCTSGDLQIAGQLTSGHSFTDFAELFPNLTGAEQGYGLLQTIDGFGVRPANEGERVIGVTSATAGIILGDTPFSWQGRWLKDEWGAYIYETIIDEETREEITYPKENPEWNPELEQQSRLQRPDEWTVVGLVGQVYVRLKEDVEVMDYVKAWQDGIGQTSQEPTNIQVMKITQEYDEEKGYKIGFCLLK